MFQVWIDTLEQVTMDLNGHTRDFDYDYDTARDAYRILNDMEGFGDVLGRLSRQTECILDRKRSYQDITQTLGKVTEAYSRYENRIIDYAEGVREVNRSSITWNLLNPEILSGMDIRMKR